MKNEFLAGVIEGFYGQPWTARQRAQLITRMTQWGLNTYFYAPKDDLKHRAIWREKYTDSELEPLRQLVDGCHRSNICFVYGLSPGLDIRFADADEQQTLQGRLEQMRQIGVRNFALLFDDLPGQINVRDQRMYDSVAAAQCSIANQAYEWLKREVSDGHMFFCPTPYCDRMDQQQLGGEGYLEAVGTVLHTDIDIFWTGPEIISEEIPVDSIQRLSTRIGRKPVLWDNLHANDYDLRRLYCGPYAGRSQALKQHVRGILSNPNCEYPVNYVPLRTLGAYVQCETNWSPREAYLSALSEWHNDFTTVGLPLTIDDLLLLADCYYLPFAQGPEANKMVDLIQNLVSHPVEEWGSWHTEFDAINTRIQQAFDKLTQLKDRELFYAWNRRAWELKEELDLFAVYLQRRRETDNPETGITSPSHLPKTYRGGVVAELQRVLAMDETGRFHPR